MRPRPSRTAISAAAIVLGAGLLLAGCDRGAPGKTVLRIGHFPNVTHAQGVIGHALSRKGKGWFEERLGPGVEVQWFVFNAGPSVAEALFANSLELTYVGPNPALNAYLRSKGQVVRVIRGAAVGGSALVVQGDGRIKSPSDFRGRKVGTPQLGNTQDVACRAWLIAQGFHVSPQGGDVQVLPAENPDLLQLFKKGDVDAAWTVEPWVSRLLIEAGGKLMVEEPEAVTTVLAARARFLHESPDLARRFAKAHEELTAWIAANPAEAKGLLGEELLAETKGALGPGVLEAAWSRLKFTAEVSLDSFRKALDEARKVGLLQEGGDVAGIVDPLK